VSTSSRERDERRQVRREQLQHDAVEAIRQLGPRATMEQLAAAGGVTKPILYRHFGDRDGLIAALGAQFGAALLDQVAGSLDASTDDPRALLAGTIDAYLAFIEEEPNLYRFLVQQAVARPAGLSAVNALVEVISQRVASVLGERLRALGADSGPATPWAFGIVGMVHQAGDWWLEHPTMPRHRLVEYLTELLWDGLASAAPAHREPSAQ
jgi:AcrR family transcriptional regulator